MKSETIDKIVDQNDAPTRTGQRETHTVESLAKRVLATESAIIEFLKNGILNPQNAVRRGAESEGPWVFSSDDLNAVRQAVLASLVEESLAGSDDETPSKLAAHSIIRGHKQQFEAKPQKLAPTSLSRVGAVVSLGRPEDDEQDGLATRTAKGLGKAALLAGGLYAGAGYIRGRMLPGETGPGIAGHLGALRRGTAANGASIKNVLARWQKLRLGTTPAPTAAPRTNFSRVTPGAHRLLTALVNAGKI